MIISIFIVTCGFSFYEYIQDDSFKLEDFYDYQKTYKTVSEDTCALGISKTYMDYRATTDRTSDQYWFIRNNMSVEPNTGFLLDEDGFIGVALGSYYGRIGDRYYFTFDNGITLPLVKVEEKADKDTDPTGCYHTIDDSVVEFVTDSKIAADYFGRYANGLVLQGNYANYSLFSGAIVSVEKVTDEKIDNHVSYELMESPILDIDQYYYASGY